MKKISLFIFVALATLALSPISCKEKETNPCEGLLSEGPLPEVMVQAVDKITGEPLKVDAKLITVTDKKSGKPFVHWRTDEQPLSPELDGAVSLMILNETPGVYEYQIQLGDKGSATLSYMVERTKTDNVCRPYVYPIGDIKIVDQPFEIFKREGKSYPKILVVKL